MALIATVLLAAQGQSSTTTCNANTLLNEFTDCHLPCGVHTHGAATGSMCSTNFCGSDGRCCRQGVTAGACDGLMGCNGWHCCVCTSSSTNTPTGAPAVSVAGDPFTTFQGKKTQFYMPPGVVMPLLKCGHTEISGRAVNSNVKDDKQQWFDMFQVNIDGARVLSAEARRTVEGSAEAAEGVDAQVLASALERLRLATATQQATVRSLTTLNVQVGGKATNATGSHSVNGATIAITQDGSKSIGSGFAEMIQFDAADIGMKIQSSVAGKFANDEDRVRNIHVDIAFTNIDASKCSGALPEIWGVKSMSKATAKLLMPQ